MKEIINGSHKEQGKLSYFEWWYFHFVPNKVSAINVVVHETDIFGLQDQPYYSISLKRNGRAPEYRKSTLSRSDIIQGSRFLNISSNQVQEGQRALSFSFNFPDQLVFKGKIDKTFDPVVVDDGLLFKDKNGDSSFWVVNIPYGVFTGVLEKDGFREELTGIAYQDHQWGTLPIQSFVSDWVWGNFISNKSSAVFFKILTNNGVIIDRWIRMDNGKLEFGSEFDADYFDALSKSIHLARGSFGGDALGDLRFNVEPDGVMRSRVNESYGNFTASYFRWAADGVLDSDKAYGITEYLRIR